MNLFKNIYAVDSKDVWRSLVRGFVSVFLGGWLIFSDPDLFKKSQILDFKNFIQVGSWIFVALLVLNLSLSIYRSNGQYWFRIIESRRYFRWVTNSLLEALAASIFLLLIPAIFKIFDGAPHFAEFVIGLFMWATYTLISLIAKGARIRALEEVLAANEPK